MLEPVGLDELAEQVYRTLLPLPAATAAVLAERLDIPIDKVESTLASLEAAGLVSAVPGAGRRFRAAHPEVALGPTLRRREYDLKQLRTAMAKLADVYASRVPLRRGDELVEVVHGSRAIRQRMEQLQLSARHTVRGLVKPPIIALTSDENEAERDIIASGVRFRVIYDAALLNLAGDPFRIVRAARYGEESRVLDALPIKLAIADDDLALVPVGPDAPDEEPAAVLVHRSGLLDALTVCFDGLWARAMPIVVASDGQPTADPAAGIPGPSDRLLLSLLLAGLTDQAVATQLDVSVRTVQRRVHDLIALAGVQTRVQLVWEAGKRGWI